VRGRRFEVVTPPLLPKRQAGADVTHSRLYLLFAAPQADSNAGRRGTIQVLFLHKATFVLWLAVMSMHVLSRTWAAIVILGERQGSHRVPGGWWRAAAMTVVAAAGAVAGLLVLPFSDQWTHGF
jgi:hypothetical protein